MKALCSLIVMIFMVGHSTEAQRGQYLLEASLFVDGQRVSSPRVISIEKGSSEITQKDDRGMKHKLTFFPMEANVHKASGTRRLSAEIGVFARVQGGSLELTWRQAYIPFGEKFRLVGIAAVEGKSPTESVVELTGTVTEL